MRGKCEGHLIFIEVALHVGSHAYEHGKLAASQVGHIVDKAFGMNPHLQAFIVAEVLLRVAIYAAPVACLKAGYLHRQRLLVELCYLRLSGIHNTCHPWRQHIVHGFAVGILFDVDN